MDLLDLNFEISLVSMILFFNALFIHIATAIKVFHSLKNQVAMIATAFSYIYFLHVYIK